MIQNISVSLGIANQQAIAMKQQANQTLRELTTDKKGAANDAFVLTNNSQANISDAIIKQQLTSKIQMSDIEKETLNTLLAQHEVLVNNTQQYGEQLQAAKDAFELQSKQIANKADNTQNFYRDDKWIADAMTAFDKNQDINGGITILRENIDELQQKAFAAKQSLEGFLKGQNYSDSSIQWILSLQKSLSATEVNIDDLKNKLFSLKDIKPFEKTNYEEQINNLKKLSTEYANLSAAQSSISKLNFKPENNNTADIERLTQDAENLKNTLETLQQKNIELPGIKTDATIQSITDLIQQLKNKEIDAEKFQEDMQAIFNNVNSGLDNGINANNQAVSDLFTSLRSALPSELSGQIDELEKNFYKLSESEEAAARGGKSIEQSEAGIKKFLESIKGTGATFGTALTGIASSVTAVASAYNSLKGVVNVWKDSDASTMDKIMSSMSSLGMVVLSLGRSYSALSKIKLADVKSSLQSVKAAIIKAAADKLAGTSAATSSSGIMAKVASEIADAAAADAAAASTQTFAASLLVFLGPILLVVAAIAALVAIIALSVKAYNADAIAAEKAAAAAEELGKKSEEVAQKAQEIKDIFSRYDEAVDALNNCTKGTEEWYDALARVNDLVLDIIAEHPELAGSLEIERDENGMLLIKNAEEIIAEAESAAQNAKAAAIMGNISASQARLKSDQTNTRRQFEEIPIDGDQYDEAAAQRNQIRNDIINHASDYAGMTPEEFQKALVAKGLSLSGTALSQFQDAINNLAEQSNALANQMEASATVLAEAELGDLKDEFGNALYGGFEKDYAASLYTQQYQEEYNKVIAAANKYKKGQSRKDLLSNSDSIWHQYLEAIGESTSTYHLAKNAIRGNDDDRAFYFTRGTSTTEEKVTKEEMAATIAAAKALQELGN